MIYFSISKHQKSLKIFLECANSYDIFEEIYYLLTMPLVCVIVWLC